MHAYGGAKSGMAQALQSIASEGWIPLAAAMVGTSGNARKMRTFFTRRLEPKTKSSNAFKWSLRPKRK